MKRKKKAVLKFVRWLERHNGFDFPPTIIAWYSPALLVGGTACLGVTKVAKQTRIAAAGKLDKKTVMYVLAHEFYHYMYATLGGADYTEEQEEVEANIFANSSVFSYYADIKIKRWKRKGWKCEL